MSRRIQLVDFLVHTRAEVENQEKNFLVILTDAKSPKYAIYYSLLSNIRSTLERIDNILKAECKHEYIEDLIDITPDRSQKITYCKICSCTF